MGNVRLPCGNGIVNATDKELKDGFPCPHRFFCPWFNNETCKGEVSNTLWDKKKG